MHQSDETTQLGEECQTRSPWVRPGLEKLEMARTAGALPGVTEGALGTYT